MSAKNPQAFPRPFSRDVETAWAHDDGKRESQQGMTLRDYFAAKAMQGIVSSIDSEENYVRLADLAQGAKLDTVSRWIARESYKQADAMLAERERS